MRASASRRGLPGSVQCPNIDALPCPAAIFDLDEHRLEAANDGFHEAFGRPGTRAEGHDVLVRLLGLPSARLSVRLSHMRPGELLSAGSDAGHDRGACDTVVCAIRLAGDDAGRLLVLVLDHAPPAPSDELAKADVLRTLLDCSFDDLWALNVDSGKYEMMSTDVTLGYASGTIRDEETFFALIHPDDRQTVLEGTEQIIKTGGSVAGRYRMRRADGMWAMIDDRAVMLESGADSKRVMVGALRDVSSEYEKELATRKAQSLYSSLFLNATYPAVEFDDNNRIIEVNVAAAKYFGVDRQRVVNRSLFVLMGKAGAALVTGLATGGESGSTEITVGEGDEARYLLVSVIGCDTGQSTTWFALGVDVTSQRRTSMALEASQALLTERTAALEDTNTALRVVLDQTDKGRRELERNVISNVDALISPLLDRLGRSLKHRPEEQQIIALRTTLQQIAKPLRRTLTAEYVPQEPLTPRETEVLHLVKCGLTSAQIAESLHLSEPTVAFHRSNIRKKLGLTGARARLSTQLGSIGRGHRGRGLSGARQAVPARRTETD